MASIMKYVQNSFYQLPTYCFAEENLMPESCCKVTLTEEKHEAPLISPGSTLHYDNQQQSVRPPPGFPPLSEQRVPSSLPTTNFHNGNSFANASNPQASVISDAEATTNPFLDDQQFIYAKQLYMLVWNENKKLQISVIDILRDLLERSLVLKDQIQLNNVLTLIEQVLLEQKGDYSTDMKTPSAPDPASGPTLNDVGSAQKVPYNLNSETFTKQDLNANTIPMSSPFGVNSDDRPPRPQSNTAFSTYSSDSFTFKPNWSQSNEPNPHMQMPPSTASPAPSTFVNHTPPANTFLPNTNQDGEKVPMTPVSPAIPTNTSNNFSEILETVNIQFANMLNDTNPFKFLMTNGTQVPETQSERTSHAHNYDAGTASYLSARNPQSHDSKTETMNIHTRSFTPATPAGYVSENYTPRTVYESGPVMYNTQKQADADARQNICSNNLDNIPNAHVTENYTPRMGYESGPVMYNTQKQADADARQNICSNNLDNIPNAHVTENYTPRMVYESGPVMYNTQKKQADTDARQNTCSNLNNIQNAPVTENYTPRIVYESGPVMFNTQKKQADTDARQNTCSNNLNIQNAQSRELGQDQKPTSQPATNIATSYTPHQVKNQITRDNPQVDETYVTRLSTYYTKSSQPIIKGKPTHYQQNGNVNNLPPVSSQSWNQVEIPEHWSNFKFQTSVPLSNHNENAAFGTPTTRSRQDLNCDNGRKSTPRETSETIDSSYVFKFKDSCDKERPMDIYTNSWNIENRSVQQRARNVDSFVFQKIDSVTGVTFIFNIENDGWILTYEFVEVFTNLKFQSHLLATLEAMNIKVAFKEIQRSQYPLQFSQLDRYPLNVPRDSEKRIISINLISLQAALALLHRLKIVSREEIENAFKKNEFLDGSILPTLWILIVTYRDLRRRIQLCSNYI